MPDKTEGVTRNKEPGTRNPEPGTRNKEPGTRNPEPGTRNAGSAVSSSPAHAKLDRLAERPKYLRASARGLAVATAGQTRIDPSGGDFHAGLIRGVSLCTRGEALGHDLWLDSDFIASVADLGAESPKGVKARFTHPGLSSDGLGTFLGRLQNIRTTGDPSAPALKAVGELHFSQAAHRTPDGDLAQYVMELAEGDPEAFAMSIVFEPDYEAEGEFILANGGKITASGYIDDSDFVSPDAGNTRNLPHARLAALRGCDVVDEPAANPDGLFHREQQFAQEADAMMSYALGLSKSAPACVALSGGVGLHPQRVKTFIAKFLDAHGLQLTSTTTDHNHEETEMAEETIGSQEPVAGSQEEAKPEIEAGVQEPVAGSQEEAKPAAESSSPEPIAGSQEEAKPAAESGSQDPVAGSPEKPAASQPAVDNGLRATAGEARLECGRFIAAFGAQGGQWYAEGLSFEQAQAKHAEALAAENAELRKRLAAAGGGEANPLEFQPSREPGGKKQFADIIKIRGGK
jgi:hypothetical protein